MKFKVKDIFIKAAGLKEGVYFAREVENIKLEIIGEVKKEGLIPIMIKKEDGNYLIDIPDSVVERLKHRDGSEIDLISDRSIYVL
ncbi:hypothetical protein DRP05_08725 [Archaeoglobales archaeon]|nr:MAG: hypothetical protein DRP05_08725 [Archaeoglobales archaeon]